MPFLSPARCCIFRDHLLYFYFNRHSLWRILHEYPNGQRRQSLLLKNIMKPNGGMLNEKSNFTRAGSCAGTFPRRLRRQQQQRRFICTTRERQHNDTARQ
jgi:hypothetical protein